MIRPADQFGYFLLVGENRRLHSQPLPPHLMQARNFWPMNSTWLRIHANKIKSTAEVPPIQEDGA